MELKNLCNVGAIVTSSIVFKESVRIRGIKNIFQVTAIRVHYQNWRIYSQTLFQDFVQKGVSSIYKIVRSTIVYNVLFPSKNLSMLSRMNCITDQPNAGTYIINLSLVESLAPCTHLWWLDQFLQSERSARSILLIIGQMHEKHYSRSEYRLIEYTSPIFQ